MTQIVAVQRGDSMFPKEHLRAQFEHCPAPDFSRGDEPHAVLAELPFSVYNNEQRRVLVKALKRKNRPAAQEICRRNSSPQ